MNYIKGDSVPDGVKHLFLLRWRQVNCSGGLLLFWLVIFLLHYNAQNNINLLRTECYDV
jgi:hypothetical protein